MAAARETSKYDEVVTKYHSLTVKAMGEDPSRKVVDFVAGSLDASVKDLLALLFPFTS